MLYEVITIDLKTINTPQTNLGGAGHTRFLFPEVFPEFFHGLSEFLPLPFFKGVFGLLEELAGRPQSVGRDTQSLFRLR